MGRHSFSPEEVEAQRARVVRAAERLFAEHGYEGVTLRALAKSLDQSPTAVYRYFEGKAAIFTAARIAAYHRFAEGQEQATREGTNPADCLDRLGTAYFAFAVDDPDGYRLMFELKQPEEARTPELREAEMRSWAQLYESISAAVDEGFLEGDPGELAHLFWAGLHGIVSLHLAGKLRHGLPFEALQRPMKRLLFAGSGAATPPPEPSSEGSARRSPS
jgi:AcrR family transcriptional regulator